MRKKPGFTFRSCRDATICFEDPTRGDSHQSHEHVTLLLRAIAETTSGPRALTLPILKAVSMCLEAICVQKGLSFLDAVDQINLAELHASLTGLGFAD